MAAHIENLMSKVLLDFSECSSKPEEFLKYASFLPITYFTLKWR